MSVASVSSWRVAADCRAAFIDGLREARAQHEQRGGKVSVWNNSVAGENVGIVEYWIEHRDLEAHGRFSESLGRDAAYQDWFARFTSKPLSWCVVATRVVQSVE